jgi:hypothetical protein
VYLLFVLATIADEARLGIAVDLESGQITKTIPTRPEFFDRKVVGRAACRPFGITWNEAEIFIVNNRQLLVFDKKLRYLRTLTRRLHVNMHQIAFRNGRVWAVSPWTNSLIGVCPADPDENTVEFDLRQHIMRPHLEREVDGADDKAHFNSLLWADDQLFVSAHMFGGASYINCYDEPTLRLRRIYRNAGSSIHGIGSRHGELFWISTNTQEILSTGGYRFALPRQGYARGFAMTERYLVVGVSERLARGQRQAGDSWIQVIDTKEGKIAREYQLRDTGCINDLRLLDGVDYAHGVQPLAKDGGMCLDG